MLGSHVVNHSSKRLGNVKGLPTLLLEVQVQLSTTTTTIEYSYFNCHIPFPHMMNQSPYAPAASIPLIKSPSLRVPRPVVLPQDIHPLPESMNEYFVYPFTLEPHTITLESSRRTTLASHAARREAYLRARDEEKERRKREALRRIAPGFEPHGHLLVPTKGISTAPIHGPREGEHRDTNHPHDPPRSVMDDLVDQLAALEGSSTNSRSTFPPS